MKISEDKTENTVVLKLEGRFDASSTSSVKGKVDAVIESNVRNLVIDMGGISFIDSSGLGTLVAALRTVNKAGGNIKISSLKDQVRSIFELTRLHHLFEIFNDPDTAAKSF